MDPPSAGCVDGRSQDEKARKIPPAETAATPCFLLVSPRRYGLNPRKRQTLPSFQWAEVAEHASSLEPRRLSALVDETPGWRR